MHSASLHHFLRLRASRSKNKAFVWKLSVCLTNANNQLSKGRNGKRNSRSFRDVLQKNRQPIEICQSDNVCHQKQTFNVYESYTFSNALQRFNLIDGGAKMLISRWAFSCFVLFEMRLVLLFLLQFFITMPMPRWSSLELLPIHHQLRA